MPLAESGAAAEGSSAVYYRFRDADGREHIVDSLDRVPSALRPQAQRIELPVSAESAAGAGSTDAGSAAHESSISKMPASLAGVDGWSFGIGFGSALCVALLFASLRKRANPLFKLVLLGAVGAAVAGAYLGWIRRQTGQSGAVLAAPSAFIEDARSAVEKLNRRNQEQEQVLREIGKPVPVTSSRERAPRLSDSHK
jgi:hypothetical protein